MVPQYCQVLAHYSPVVGLQEQDWFLQDMHSAASCRLHLRRHEYVYKVHVLCRLQTLGLHHAMLPLLIRLILERFWMLGTVCRRVNSVPFTTVLSGYGFGRSSAGC